MDEENSDNASDRKSDGRWFARLRSKFWRDSSDAKPDADEASLPDDEVHGALNSAREEWLDERSIDGHDSSLHSSGDRIDDSGERQQQNQGNMVPQRDGGDSVDGNSEPGI